MDTADALYNDRVRKFTEFLDAGNTATDYRSEIMQMLAANRTRLIVSLDELREFDRTLWRGALDTPAEMLPAMVQALKETAMALRIPGETDLDEDDSFYVGFRGTFGSHLVTPRTIGSNFLGMMVCVEGIVARSSIVRPKVARSIHYGEATNEFFARDYRDQTTSFDPMPSSTTYPTEDGQGNPLVVEYGLSKYRDHQMISVQEMPERAPPGQLPRGMEVIMDDDLVDKVKPGDRIQVVGVYRSVGGGGSAGAERSSTFRSLILGNNVVLLTSKGGDSVARAMAITEEDIRNFVEVAKRPNVCDLLARSLAPSIYGLKYVKRAVLLQLLGGSEKNLANGTHIRGDINVLMVGDPSTAKSQMLRFVLNTAALAVATTGRGSTGVGLTAAVTTDKETGERRLEAGAMVMADRGVVCVDEFDKMSDADRVAIHEVMEQQTVTVSKAGIHMSLNARCSVLAAANPVYGQYDPHKDPHKNIALPDSLLSRFDLLFVVTDDVGDTKDRNVSEHVLRMHQYQPAGLPEGVPQRERTHTSLAVGGDANANEDVDPAPVYATSPADEGEDLLTITFLRRYVHYAKQRIKPVLGTEAAELIAQTYTDLRNDNLAQGQRRTTPITARTLETLIRLATAHAKARLSQRVEEEDALAAEEILRYALFREVLVPSRQKRRRLHTQVLDESSASEAEEEEDDEDDDNVQLSGDEDPPSEPEVSDKEDSDREDSEESETEQAPRRQRLRREPTQSREPLHTPPNATGTDGISSSRLQQFISAAGRALAEAPSTEDSIPLDRLIELVNNRFPTEDQFGGPEARAAVDSMDRDNKVFWHRETNKIYRV